MPLNKISSTDGYRIFCHFLNRELHEALGTSFKPEIYLRAIRLATIFHNESMFCNVSQLFEAASSYPGLISEISELSRAEIFLPHSEYERTEELVESRRTLYQHDEARYSMYFQKPAIDLRDLSLVDLGDDVGTTKSIEQRILQLSDSEMGDKNLIYVNDLKAIRPSLDDIKRVTEDRGERAMTLALYRSQGLSTVNNPIIEGALRRILSAHYINHYTDEFKSVTFWHLPNLRYYDQGRGDANLNFYFLNEMASLLEIEQYLNKKEKYGIYERILNYSSPDRMEFVASFSRLSAAMAALIGETGNDLSTRGGRVRKAFALVRSMTVENQKVSEASSYRDALRVASLRVKRLSYKLAESYEVVQVALKKFDAPRQRLLIATATTLEDDIFVEEFKCRGIEKVGTNRDGESSISYFGVHGGIDVYHVRSSAGSVGASGSALVVSDAAGIMKPDMIVSAGICFGLKEKRQEIGDLVIANRVRIYEPQRVAQSAGLQWPWSRQRITPRGDVVSAGATLLDRCRDLRTSWRRAPIHEGLLVSGEKLVDSSAFRNALLELEPEAIAGEMEGAGIVSVCQRRQIEWIVLKGICDFGFGKTKEGQPEAARNAFHFLGELIQSGRLSKSTKLVY